MAAVSEEMRWDVLARDNYTCVYCGHRPRSLYLRGRITLHVDHMYPRSRGGSNSPDNLVTACASCNLSKHARILPHSVVPIATCGDCGKREHPRGGAFLCEIGAVWFCPTCAENQREREELLDSQWEERGPWGDLELEQYAWDALEFAGAPEVLDNRYPDLRR